MPKRDLGEVKGKDGGFGDVSAEYIDNGGDPSVEIETQGDNQAKSFIFKFKNLVRSALSNEQIDRIVSNEVVTSSSVVTGTGLTSFWSKIKEKFALKNHTHETTDLLNEAVTTPKIANEAVTTEKIDDKAITQAKIADGAVGETQLDQSLRNSIFHTENLELKTPAATYSEYYLNGPYGKLLLQVHNQGIGYFLIGDDGSENMIGYTPWSAS